MGVILAIAMAAVLFFAASWGYLKLVAGRTALGVLPGGNSLWHDRAVIEGFGVLAAVGLAAGILVAIPRISPLAAGLPGLVLLAWTGLYLSSARRAVRYVPLKTRPYGAGFEDLLFDGVLALAGLVMIIPLFVPSRWRRRYVAAGAPDAPGAPAAPESDVTSYPDAQATQTMTGGSVFTADWPATSTRPQPRIDPKSQAPWGPAEYS
ncbi:MAG: hypothetical protein ABSB76_22885 [Streptosporangiaceae bacterium]